MTIIEVYKNARAENKAYKAKGYALNRASFDADVAKLIITADITFYESNLDKICITKETVNLGINEDSDVMETEERFSYCSNFLGDVCKNTECPSYKKYSNYIITEQKFKSALIEFSAIKKPTSPIKAVRNEVYKVIQEYNAEKLENKRIKAEIKNLKTLMDKNLADSERQKDAARLMLIGENRCIENITKIPVKDRDDMIGGYDAQKFCPKFYPPYNEGYCTNTECPSYKLQHNYVDARLVYEAALQDQKTFKELFGKRVK